MAAVFFTAVFLAAGFLVTAFFPADFLAAVFGAFLAVVLTDDFFAAVFFAAVFFAVVFFAGDFFAGVFFAEAFFAADFEADFFAADFFVDDFLLGHSPRSVDVGSPAFAFLRVEAIAFLLPPVRFLIAVTRCFSVAILRPYPSNAHSYTTSAERLIENAYRCEWCRVARVVPRTRALRYRTPSTASASASTTK